MTLTAAQAIALLDALRAEILANPDGLTVTTQWYPCTVVLEVRERAGLTEHRLTTILNAAERTDGGAERKDPPA